jgi:hypothetical protein
MRSSILKTILGSEIGQKYEGSEPYFPGFRIVITLARLNSFGILPDVKISVKRAKIHFLLLWSEFLMIFKKAALPDFTVI